jgi:hypothetical protein
LLAVTSFCQQQQQMASAGGQTAAQADKQVRREAKGHVFANNIVSEL